MDRTTGSDHYDGCSVTVTVDTESSYCTPQVAPEDQPEARGEQPRSVTHSLAALARERAAAAADGEEPPECRFCKEEEGEMVAPCVCEGSLKWVHPACLGEWITKRSESHNTVCEICNSPYEVDLVRRLHWNRALLCSRASVGFFSEACTMLFCLVSLLWVFVLSHDWKPSNQKNDPDVRRIRADTSEPVFWLVLSIGLAMACFTLYTLRKMTQMWLQAVSTVSIAVRPPV